ncbi:EAL domain-containing protein [Metabacillus sp. GX 13764]|uniref:sensor domain-containing protein n=1 Tax=Metabacillus kandeliae TaxID=2900151 RepID=UPI001E2B2657|nr:bifunctional diguanylate cyclase/phosphodiesterase [Metabacillus kandeliae]MCD7034022.1 EAL domain-containing protein [Metabacillus kandeliae]
MLKADSLHSFVDIPVYFLCTALSCVTCFLILHYAKSFVSGTAQKRLFPSILVGTLFWGTQLLFYKSLHLSISLDMAKIGTLLLFILILYILFKFLTVKRTKLHRFIFICIFVTLSLLSGDYIGFYPLYAGKAEWNFILVAMCFVIVFGFSSAAVQLLYQIMEETSKKAAAVWKLLGSIFAGVALAGIPYMVILSVVPLSTNAVLADHLNVLLPYLLDLIALVILGFVPTYYSYRKLEFAKEEYESLFQHNLDAVIALDTKGVITSVNNPASILFGFKKEEMIGSTYKLISDMNKVSPYFKDALSGTTFSFEMDLPRKNGETVRALTSVIPIMADSKVSGLYCIVKDMADLRKAEDKIHQLAYFDDSTQLPNSKMFKKMAASASGPFALILVSIVNLSKIADLYDENTAEQAFQMAAERLKKRLPEHCLLSRLDTGTFSFIYSGGDWESILEEMMKELEKPISIKDMEINLSCRAGAAEDAGALVPLDESLRMAGVALKFAKASAVNTIVRYQDGLNETLHHELYLETELSKALHRDELTVFYQPKYHLPSGQYNSAEALVRWNHPEMGMISPAVFIPIAEKSGQIKKLEEIVLNKAAKQMKQWLQDGSPVKKVAVNFSHYHFYDESLVETICSILRKHELDPAYMEIEITESTMIENRSETIKKLDELRSRGIKISLDDFGTGFSSLSYLQDLPLDTLKIDRSFIKRINSNEQSNAIISSIITLAGHLNLEVVAEGVETEEQLSFLKELSCPSIQGYYYSPPLPSEELEGLFEARAV